MTRPPGATLEQRESGPAPAPAVAAAGSPAAPSRLRAWFYLVRLCLKRQLRAPQMAWIALGLLALTVAVVGLNTLGDRWGMHHWRYPRGVGPRLDALTDFVGNLPRPAAAAAVQNAVWGATRASLAQSGFRLFTTWWVLGIFLSFLLPVWSLSFATEAIGGEREGRTLAWLLSQPIPRPLVYLAKFVALLPFALGLNVGGFALLCLAAGRAGRPALGLFWPAVALGTLAFCALFQMMGAVFRRPAVVAIAYSFFLEAILGNMPGTMKRVSLGFYTRCMMFEEGRHLGVEPEKPSIYLPVEGSTAAAVLVAVTVVLLAAGAFVFTRSEYHEVT
jgi:hypothetical protein